MPTPAPDQAFQSPAAVNGSHLVDSEFRYVLFTVVYSVIFVLGVIANTYVLYVLRSLREATAMGEIRIYMTNLTIADLLFVCALPFWVGYYSRHGNWVYSDFLCRVTGTMFFINTYSSVLFLATISVNRYWAVTRPLDAASSDHRRRGILISVAIWVGIVLSSVPYLVSSGINDVISGNSTVHRCSESYNNSEELMKKFVAALHFLLVGLIFAIFALVVVCNVLIARTLLSQKVPRSEFRSTKALPRKSTLSSADNRPRGVKRRALQMLWAVVGVFTLCFIPHHALQGLWSLAVLEIREGWGRVDWSIDTRQALNDAHQVTTALMGFNCILDPVVYFFATRKFRRFIKTHVKKFVKGEGCSQTAVSQLSMDMNQSQRLQGEPQHQEEK